MNNEYIQEKEFLLELREELVRKHAQQSLRIAELEEFLKIARIPDAQEWRRKELLGESND